MIAICTHLMQDRARCDALLAQTCADIGAMAWSSALRSMAATSHALARHLQLEEQYLFAPYDALMEGGRAATAALRAEHERVSAALTALEQAAASHQRDMFLCQADALRSLLAHHHLKEADAFYPLVARVLKARTALASAPQSSPSSPPRSGQEAGTHSASSLAE